jgi:hypothetical protein
MAIGVHANLPFQNSSANMAAAQDMGVNKTGKCVYQRFVDGLFRLWPES